MQIKEIETDEQWYKCLRRALKTDESILAFGRLMIGTFPNGNWIRALKSNGRKYKKNRLLKMIWEYYDNLTPERRYECFNKVFETSLSKDAHLFKGWG